MIVRGCHWKPLTSRVATPTFIRAKQKAAKPLGGLLATAKDFRPRASPWSPTPYQWAPLPESGQGLTDGALERKDFGKFVQFFRQASPYIEGHRGRTFVVVIPGEVRQRVIIATPRTHC